MEKTINHYSYTNAAGMPISIRTEKYGVCGFDVFVTVEKLGLRNARANLFKNLRGEWLIALGEVNGRNTMIRPADDILKAMLADRNTPTEERRRYDDAERERKRKERAFDNLYNEGAEGYNPYRRNKQGIKDNTPIYKEDDEED